MSQTEELFSLTSTPECPFPLYFMIENRAMATLWYPSAREVCASMSVIFCSADFPRFVAKIVSSDYAYEDLPSDVARNLVRQTIRSLKTRDIKLDSDRALKWKSSNLRLQYCAKVRYMISDPPSRKRGREGDTSNPIPVNDNRLMWSMAIQGTAFDAIHPEIMANYIFPMMLQATIDACDDACTAEYEEQCAIDLLSGPRHLSYRNYTTNQKARLYALWKFRELNRHFKSLIDTFYPAIVTHLPAPATLTCCGCNRPLPVGKGDAWLKLLYTVGNESKCVLGYEHARPDNCVYSMKMYVTGDNKPRIIGSTWFMLIGLPSPEPPRVILRVHCQEEGPRVLQVQRAILLNQMDSPILISHIMKGPCGRFVD